MKSESKLTFTLTVNASHDDDAGNISKRDIKSAVANAVSNIIKEEVEQDSEISILITHFEYTDNTTAMRESLYERMNKMTASQLADLADYIGE